VEGSGNLIAVVEFADKELNPIASQVFNFYVSGYMRAVSVGFRPIDAPTYNKEGGLDFKTVELLEPSSSTETRLFCSELRT
jgi:hypothetical protein